MCALLCSADRAADERLWHAALDLRKPRSSDALVEFYRLATSARCLGQQFYLIYLLGSPIDLVTTQPARPQLRPFVERDAIHV